MDCMGFKLLGNLHLVVVGEKDPTAVDWKLYLDAIKETERRGLEITSLRTLVFSDGAGPNAQQRKMLADHLNGRPSPLAIVTGVTIMRGVITALRWFNPEVRAFAPGDLQEALKFLDVPPYRQESIIRDAVDIQGVLQIPKVKAVESAKTGFAGAYSSP